jgi:CO/xanthine dehydrogenase Mo-binding subunit
MLFDPATGRPLNPNFLDYKIPTAMDIPEIEPVFVETDEPTGPFGNKGLAEPPILAQAPAVRNAILHATGRRHLRDPHDAPAPGPTRLSGPGSSGREREEERACTM